VGDWAFPLVISQEIGGAGTGLEILSSLSLGTAECLVKGIGMSEKPFR
jgi:hypothetical protein